MLIAELGLAPGTKRALRAAGIKTIDQLQRPANVLLASPLIDGGVLYDVAYRLHAHGLGFRTKTDTRRSALPTEGDLEILRLRVVEGLALREIATICGVSRERVRQILNLRFGLNGDPPAVTERRRLRMVQRPEWERIIALRLSRARDGLLMAVLLRGFAEGTLGGEARAAVARMEAKGLVSVVRDRVRPTAALRSISEGTSSIGTSRGMGSARAGR